MRIILFGGSGQLGYELKQRSSDLHFEVFSPVTKEVNITDREQVHFLIKKIKPDIVINSAAYTLVDHAETEHEKADLINHIGASYIAEGCELSGSRMIHISTDYVFDGNAKAPLSEEAETNPVNYYGETKLRGEQAVQKILGDRSLIVRTSSLHGQKGINFVHTMLKLFKEQPQVRVVDDQIMSPTWAGYLAEVVLDLARLNVGGVVHACGKGEVSWYGFAAEILKIVSASVPEVELTAITSEQFVRPAKRPHYSVMSTSKLAKLLGRSVMTWQEGLRQHLSELGYNTDSI